MEGGPNLGIVKKTKQTNKQKQNQNNTKQTKTKQKCNPPVSKIHILLPPHQYTPLHVVHRSSYKKKIKKHPAVGEKKLSVFGVFRLKMKQV